MNAGTLGSEVRNQITVRIADLKWMVRQMSKQRLINANTLVGADGLFATRGCVGNCNNCNLWSKEGCRVILDAPTVDAVEVMHGYWEPTSYMIPNVSCSICKTLIREEFEKKYKYCPHCGAKMDGEKHD